MLEVRIEGMTCEGCEKTIRGTLEGTPEVTHVWNVNWKNGAARIEVEETMEECFLVSAIEKLGYKVKAAPGEGRSQQAEEEHSGTRVNFKSRAKDGDFDLLIIGAGSAGFAGAIRASELGARVGLIEGGVIGGTCVNVGCVPSKTLIRAAELQHRAQSKVFHGIFTSAKPPHWDEIRSQKDELVSLLRKVKYIDVLKSYPNVEYIEGSAKPLKAGEVELSNGKRLKAQKILITTGARPWAPPIPGLNGVQYLDSTSVMNLEKLPKSMIVIGASAVGLELAQMFSRLGVKITVIEVAPRIVPLEDQEIGDTLSQYLTEEGMNVFAGAKILKVSKYGQYEVEIDKDDKEVIAAEELLVATGRRPNTEHLGLKECGVELGPKGHIKTNEYLQTNHPDVFAAGDCTSEAMFVYVSAYEGNLAAENALQGNARKFDVSVLPKVTFTDPQVASVGITEIEAHAMGIDPSWAKISLDHIPRAVAARDTRGFIKLVAESKTGKLIGAHILAPEGGELIQIPALAIKYGITVDELGRTLFPYLTLSEGIKLCAQMFNKDVSKLSCCAA